MILPARLDELSWYLLFEVLILPYLHLDHSFFSVQDSPVCRRY